VSLLTKAEQMKMLRRGEVIPSAPPKGIFLRKSLFCVLFLFPHFQYFMVSHSF
jgi:hypothetical protein